MVVKKSDQKIKAVISESFEIPDIAEYVTAVPCALKQSTCQNASYSRTIFKLKAESCPSLPFFLLCSPFFPSSLFSFLCIVLFTVYLA